MNSLLFKLTSIGNMLLANGVGRSDGTKSGGGGSWFVEALSWLADAIVSLATLVWGWLIYLFYFVVRFILNLIDVLQMFVEKLVGIEAFNQEGGFSALEDFRDSDMIIRFIANETIIKTFLAIMGIGAVLLIIFTILAIVKSNYAAATSDGSEAGKGPGEALKKAGRAIFMCLLVPFLLIIGILGSNAVLASVCNAIKGDNDLTLGGLIYTASSYEANKFREYASDGVKVPIYISGATEVVNPGKYATDEDMQVLFYKLATNKVYIKVISDDSWFTERQKDSYSAWIPYLTEDDAALVLDEIDGNVNFANFEDDCNEFYTYYFEHGGLFGISALGGDEIPLNELNMFDPIIKSIYESNWTNNKKFKDVTYDFSSTYTTQREEVFGSVDGKALPASIIVNSDSYQNYENFATIELEYFVMADLIDYAIEHNKTFYYVNANSDGIMWSGIPNPYAEDETEATHDIAEYRADAVISADGEGKNRTFYLDYKPASGTVSTRGSEDIAEGAFCVRYYNGTTRLYFSESEATSEQTGATYIICTKTEDGKFIPVNQKTTAFKSSYLADDYYGAIVARGIFETEGVFPKDYCLPTAISEQIVDEFGNELAISVGISPYSISDKTNAKLTVGDKVSDFFGQVGKFGGLIGGVVSDVLSGVAGLAADFKQKYIDENIENKFTKLLGDDNILINKNIVGYKYVDTNGVVFYDKDGRCITAGVNYKEGEMGTEDNPFTLTEKKSNEAYVVLQQSSIGDIIIPWYAATAGDVEAVIAGATGNESLMSGGSHKFTFLVAKYTYDKLSIKLTPSESNEDEDDTGEFTLLTNMNITEIIQVDDQGTTTSRSAVSGEFVIAEEVLSTPSIDIYVERLENLYISGGEIYTSDGEMFYGRKTASANFDNFISSYIKEKYFDSVARYIANAFDSTKNKLNDYFWGLSTESEKTDLGLVDAMMAMEFKIGLASRMEEYSRKYYSVSAEPIMGVDADGNTVQTGTKGTIKYFDKHNRELGSAEYSEVNKKSGEISLILVAGMGTSGRPMENVVTTVSVVPNATALPTQSHATTIPDSIMEAILESTGIINNNIDDRVLHYYKATYKYSYYDYLLSGGSHEILGSTIDNVELHYLGTYGNIDKGLTDPGKLTLRNNVIRSNAGVALTTTGAKGYISTGGSGGVALTFPGGDETKGDVESKKLSNNVWNLKGQAEYDDYYIYFGRGELNWGLVFDFCLGLPSLSLSPLMFQWVFRCNLGSTYDYTEDVVYRLQAGGFYLDYNFREATGIGQQYLFRMAAINPFVLIFSAVLILTIVWQLVWGLIQRIYNIVLLFIMLPACCSTMPMDDGARFGKWKDKVIEEVLSAYGVLIMLNLYFVLIPIVREVTSGLITSTDLPSTITGMFSAVTVGFNQVGTSIGSKLGSIGLGATKLLEVAELTTAELNLLGYVNRIIYIIFFLVLTTMLKNGKELIKKVLDLAGDINMDAAKEAKGNIDKVSNFAKEVKGKVQNVSMKLAGGVAKTAGVFSKGAKAASKLFDMKAASSGGGSGGGGTTTTTGSYTAPTPPTSGGGSLPSGTPNNSNTAAPVNGQTVIEVPAAAFDDTELVTPVEPTETEPSLTESFVGGTPSGSVEPIIMGAPDSDDLSEAERDEIIEMFDEEFKDSTIDEVEDYIDTLRVEKDEKLKAIEKGLPSEDEIKAMAKHAADKKAKETAIKEAKEELDNLDVERAKMQDAKTFTGANKEAWDARNNAAVAKKQAAEEDLKMLKAKDWEHSETQAKIDDVNEKLEAKEKELDEFIAEATRYRDYRVQQDAKQTAIADTDGLAEEPITPVTPEDSSVVTEVVAPTIDAQPKEDKVKEQPPKKPYVSPTMEEVKVVSDEPITAEEVHSEAPASEAKATKKSSGKVKKVAKMVALGAALTFAVPAAVTMPVVGGVLVAKTVKNRKQIKEGITKTGKKLASKISKGDMKVEPKATQSVERAKTTAVTQKGGDLHETHTSDIPVDLDGAFAEMDKNLEGRQKGSVKDAINKAKTEAKAFKDRFKSNLESKISTGKLKDEPKSVKTTAVTPSAGGTTAVHATHSSSEPIDFDKVFAEGEKARRNASAGETTSGTTSTNSSSKTTKTSKVSSAKSAIKDAANKFKNMSTGKKIVVATALGGIPGLAVVAGPMAIKKGKNAIKKTIEFGKSHLTKSGREKLKREAEEAAENEIKKQKQQISDEIKAEVEKQVKAEVDKQIKASKTSSGPSKTLSPEEIAKLEKEVLEKTKKESKGSSEKPAGVAAPKEIVAAGTNKDYEAKIKNLEDKMSRISTDVNDLLEKVTSPEKTKEVKELEAKMSKMNSDVNDLLEKVTRPGKTKEVTELESKISKLNSDVHDLLEKVTSPEKEKEVKQIEAKMRKMSADINDLLEKATRPDKSSKSSVIVDGAKESGLGSKKTTEPKPNPTKKP